MGFGDVLMTMGEAKKLHEKTGKKICLPRRYCPELYREIDYITDDPANADIKLSEPFPATDVPQTTDLRIAFKKYRPYPADLITPELNHVDFENLGEFIFIEPHTKTMTSANNRNWGWENFCRVVKMIEINFVQPYYGKPVLPGVIPIPTRSFLEAAAILKKARTALMAEGGMMHAAAAVGVESVVIFGGFISPDNTGYDMHSNFFVGKQPCGSKRPCPHCVEAMKRITVDQIVKALNEKLVR